jgi:hypothetical protein
MSAPRQILFLGFLVLVASAGSLLSEEAALSRIKREPVVSSNVASIGYSRHLHALEIEFTRGAIYRFLDVPREVYLKLMAADSKGHFIAENLRGKYRFLRVRASRRSKVSGP